MRAEAGGLALLSLALAAVHPARAQTSPYGLGATAGISYDDNVFRTAESTRSDTTRSIGLTGSFDQPIGRQRIFANGTVSWNRHSRFEQLDDVSYGLTTGVDWATIANLSGGLRYAVNRALADYGVTDAPQTTEKNIQRGSQLSASLRQSPHSLVAAEASFERRTLDYSAEAYRRLDYAQRIYGLGLRFGGSGPFSLFAGWRRTEGDTPEFEVASGVFAPDELRRRDLDLSIAWQSAVSRLSARVSHSRERHTQPSYPGYSGPTWSLDGQWLPTARLRFDGSFSRDTGSATTFLKFRPGAEPLAIETSQRTTIGRFSTTYSLTARASLTGQGRWSRGRSSYGDSRRDERIRSYAIAVDYEPARAWNVTCQVNREIRASSIASLDSEATVGSCSTQFVWR